jgi:hypothetical protein
MSEIVYKKSLNAIERTSWSAIEIRFRRIFETQSIKRANFVRRIQLHRIRKEIQITNVNEKMSIVENSYAKTFDDLSLNELNDDEDF